jgi:hypothetical protein
LSEEQIAIAIALERIEPRVLGLPFRLERFGVLEQRAAIAVATAGPSNRPRRASRFALAIGKGLHHPARMSALLRRNVEIGNGGGAANVAVSQ